MGVRDPFRGGLPVNSQDQPAVELRGVVDLSPADLNDKNVLSELEISYLGINGLLTLCCAKWRVEA